MRRWRPVGIALAVGASVSLIVAVLAPFLAPNLTYEIQDRAAELFSDNRGRTYRIALGAGTGSYFLLGEVLNSHLAAKAGYTLDLVATGGVPENVSWLLDRSQQIHLATVDSASDEAVNASEIVALAAIERPYFFVMVPDGSPAREVRDLAGPVNTAVRAPDQGPTIGDKVLDYYGLLTPPASNAGSAAAVSIVRPAEGVTMVQELDSGRATAITRTQFLSSGLVDNVLDTGRFRLLPVPDQEGIETIRSLHGVCWRALPRDRAEA